jgi:small-conductance mechanosensitive channel
MVGFGGLDELDFGPKIRFPRFDTISEKNDMTSTEIDILSKTTKIGIILGIGLFLVFLMHLVLRRLENRTKYINIGKERVARLKTLFQIGRSIGHLVIFIVTLLMVLHELGINIAPILASAGVVGLAFSLGAQTIIKDFLGGVVILTENQFKIGDVITIGQTTGTVEHISLRATYLRDSDGKLNLIPNGDIRTISNLTTHWAQVVVTFNVDYEADMERALKALEESARLVQSDEKIASAILEVPYALGWTGFTDWAVQMQVIAKTQPGQQWVVARALRKIALELLQKEGIRVAVPRQRIENMP